MFVILCGMFLTGILVVRMLPPNVGFSEAVNIAGHLDKINLIDFTFNPKERYNFWSGLIGGLFLAMSYFGTDQSQVARYLQGSSVKESRLGLLFNGLLKIPMQFLILLLGVLVYVFYLFNQEPIFFNKIAVEKTIEAGEGQKYQDLDSQYQILSIERKRGG